MKPNLNTFLLIAVTALLTLQLSSLFKRSPKPADNRGEIEALQKVIEAKAEALGIYREWKDELNRQLLKKDTLLQGQIKTQTKIIYEKIPTTVRNYSNDELRRAIENY